MRKKNITAIAALIISVLIIVGGCTKNPSPGGEGGSDIAVNPEPTEIESSEAKPSSEDKLIALTFDDGPHSEYTNRVLDVLEKNGARATFFVVGYNIEKNIDTIKRAQAMGCEIGNHTNDHEILTKCDYSTLREQVDRPNEMIKNLTETEMTLFRAPGGAFKGITGDIGMPLIQWSIDTEDWKSKDAAHKNRTDAERNAELRRIADDVVNNAEKGDIVLMHDIYNFTADLSELIIPELIAKGFRLVTVSEMYEAYGESLNKGEVYYGIEFSEAVNTTQSTAVLEAGDYRVKTNGGNLNIRIEPKQNSEIIGRLSNGDSAKVIKSVPGWAYVDAPGASGWVNAAYLVK